MVKGRNTRVVGIRIHDDLYNRIVDHLAEGESAGDWVKRAVDQQLNDLVKPAEVDDVKGSEVVVQVKLHPAVFARLRDKLSRRSGKTTSVAAYCRELIERDQGFRS
ncbi:MAG: hypothetical protein PHV74_07410 [Dehalococcoidia bacterium]|nr:hypothetical protein [Dehalococcoidia bacterium]